MNATKKTINETAKIPTTRSGILLTDDEIRHEIDNYHRQIQSMWFEIRVLRLELKNRAKNQL